MNSGFYISNDNNGYWHARPVQFKAIKKLYQSNAMKFYGSRSKYWKNNKMIVIKDLKIGKTSYDFKLTPKELYIKTRDGKFRHILSVNSTLTSNKRFIKK